MTGGTSTAGIEEPALFVRDGDDYVATSFTEGGWDPAHANGGTVLALLGQHLEGVPSLVPMTLARLTADLVRPVPVGRRLRIDHEVRREGKKIQMVELLLHADGVELARVTALRLRDEDAWPATPPSTTDARPGDELVPPEDAMSFAEITPEVPGFLRAVDMRRASTRDGAAVGAWIRLVLPVVAGEPVTPTARLTATFDFANLVGLRDHPSEVTLINPDVSAHVLRPPTGDWVAITGDTRFHAALGRGVTQATLSDADGPFAVVSTSQLVQPRG